MIAKNMMPAPMISIGPSVSPNNKNDNIAVMGILLETTILQINPAIPTPQDSNSLHPNTTMTRYNAVRTPVSVAARIGYKKEADDHAKCVHALGQPAMAMRMDVTTDKHATCTERMLDQ